MRAGRVATVQQLLRNPRPARPAIQDDEAVAAAPAGTGHHWHLSDLLHPFHRR